MKPILTIFIFALFFIALPEKIKAQTNEKEENRLYSEYKIRKAKIDEELTQLKVHEWAGEYRMFDDFLTIAPNAGFAFLLRKGFGDYGYSYGKVQWVAGKLKLDSEKPNRWISLSIFSSELIPILWGEKHYLIPANDIIEFANSVNGGFEPSFKVDSFGNKFYLRVGDEDKKVFGMPNIPVQYREYLLQKPIRATILAIKGSQIKVNKDGEKYRITTFTLNVGSNKGVKEGMKFLTYKPSRTHEDATITKVGKDWSEAQIVQKGFDDKPPSTSWKLSTSIRDIK